MNMYIFNFTILSNSFSRKHLCSKNTRFKTIEKGFEGIVREYNLINIKSGAILVLICFSMALKRVKLRRLYFQKDIRINVYTSNLASVSVIDFRVIQSRL